ncbi:MAG: heme-binding domain-containing protein [Myxococcota bacterium]
MVRKIANYGLGGLVALAVLIQLVPYGRNHTNPPTTKAAAWDSPRTQELAERACFDCHSNETVWPAYASVAPFSWLVQDHVDEGREMLNFSEMDRTFEDLDEAGEVVREGEMPLPSFLWLHPEAKLTDAERLELATGLEAMFGTEGAGSVTAEGGNGGGRDNDGDED